MNYFLFLLLVGSFSSSSLNTMNFPDNSSSELSSELSSDIENYDPVAPDYSSLDEELNRGFFQDDDASFGGLSDIVLDINERRERLLWASEDYPGLSGNEVQALIDAGAFQRVAYEDLVLLSPEDEKDGYSGILFQHGDRLLRLSCYHVFYEGTLTHTLAVSSVCPQCLEPVNLERRSNCL